MKPSDTSETSEVSEAPLVETLWAMSDDGLRGLLEGEFGEDFGLSLAEHLPDFDQAITQRFGRPLLLEFYARRLATHGYDADTFRALPPAEQSEFVSRFVPGAALPAMH